MVVWKFWSFLSECAVYTCVSPRLQHLVAAIFVLKLSLNTELCSHSLLCPRLLYPCCMINVFGVFTQVNKSSGRDCGLDTELYYRWVLIQFLRNITERKREQSPLQQVTVSQGTTCCIICNAKYKADQDNTSYLREHLVNHKLYLKTRVSIQFDSLEARSLAAATALHSWVEPSEMNDEASTFLTPSCN